MHSPKAPLLVELVDSGLNGVHSGLKEGKALSKATCASRIHYLIVSKLRWLHLHGIFEYWLFRIYVYRLWLDYVTSINAFIHNHFQTNCHRMSCHHGMLKLLVTTKLCRIYHKGYVRLKRVSHNLTKATSIGKQISRSRDICSHHIGSGCATNGTPLLCMLRAFLANAQMATWHQHHG